jgi:hypothetical protein
MLRLAAPGTSQNHRDAGLGGAAPASAAKDEAGAHRAPIVEMRPAEAADANQIAMGLRKLRVSFASGCERERRA